MNPLRVAIFTALLLGASCSKTPTKTYKALSIPHCETLDQSTAKDLIERIVADRTTHVELAVSEFGLSQSQWEVTYEAFENLYSARAEEISEVLGLPSWQGSWTSDDYPDWALGEEITVWNHPSGKIYLRIYNEDDMIPIIVALGTTDSTGGFNVEGESPYTGLREHVESEGN